MADRIASSGSGTKTSGKGGNAAGADGEGGGAAKKKSKKKLIMIVVLVLVVAAAGYKFTRPAPPFKAAPGDTVAMDATTLNLAGGHYLKLALSVELVKGKASATSFQSDQAAQAVIDTFSNKTVADVSTQAKRTALTSDLKKEIQKDYPGEIWDIYLTQFVTQ